MNKYDKIVFDCDSTLVKIEGLDELAEIKGKKKKVAELTRLSMDGIVKLEDVFALKMAMIRPSKKDLINLGNIYKKTAIEDIKEVIFLLKQLKKQVFIVTGNFHPAVTMLASFLRIPQKNVYLNKIYFDKGGEYIGFDAKGYLSISGGKKIVLRKIVYQKPRKKTIFIGDGSTDMDTRPPADMFIGYGGVAQRENVKKYSDIYITSESLAPMLRYILTKDEQKKGEKIAKQLFQKADYLVRKNYVITKNCQ